MAPAMLGVPPSKRYGTSFHEARPRWTSRIISPPPRRGSVASSASGLPYKTPMPVGPSILCPLNARKSTSRSCTSIDTWCAAWAGFRSRFGEHDLVRGLGSDERRDPFARPFVLAGGLFSQFINGPMHVRVVARVEIRRRVDDLLGLLRGRGAVEVDEPAVMDLPL